MNRLLVSAPLALAALVCGSAAHASRVNWSVGIDVPAFGAVVSSAPAYYAPPPRYVPAPRYYSEPVYSAPMYAAPPVYAAPRPPHVWLPPLPPLPRLPPLPPLPFAHGPWGWAPDHWHHDAHIDYRR